MQLLRGKKFLKQIFADWYEPFAKTHPTQIQRAGIPINVEKMLKCGTEEMGFHHFQCQNCRYEKKVPHTCKSRFCSSCGVRQTDIWIETYSTLFAQCEYQHVIFSPPHEFLNYFRAGRLQSMDGSLPPPLLQNRACHFCGTRLLSEVPFVIGIWLAI
jgi:Golgi nucleoside diphosphatase